VPRWWGPMRAARRWHELGVDYRDGEVLRYGIRDLPMRDVAPFNLPGSRTKDADAEFMQNPIEERLRTRVWMELAPEDARGSRYMSRDLYTRTAMGGGALFWTSIISQTKGRSFNEAGLSVRVTGSSDTGRSDDVLRSGGELAPLPSPSGYAADFQGESGPWRGPARAVLRICCLALWVEHPRLLILPTGPKVRGLV
jgi:hypothetical protein